MDSNIPKHLRTEPAHHRPASRTRRLLAWLTLIAYIGQPLMVAAQVAADPNAAAAKRPVIDTTANGIPLVQITTPNATGLSHNQFTLYNVDPNGVILNNSNTAVLTQQAGYVSANQNMANGTARIILNEVTSTNASQLNGYTEVAGTRAEVIIANPNGITCNGCGFINTSRGMLTTGTPVFGGTGSLDAFRVSGGQIMVDSGGLNGSNTDQLDLIARSVKVNGTLWGNNLNVVTGANQVNYANLGVQIIAGSGNKPTVGIDVAQLGGMYANKIHLVGTEAGVGVNSLGTLSAQAGEFLLDNQGQITLSGNTSASGNISINGAAGTSNSGTLYSQQTVLINDQGTISNSGILSAQGNLNLNAANINSSGSLGAGIASNGAATQNGAMMLTAATVNLANSQIITGGDATLTATAGDLIHTGGTLQSRGMLALSATGMINNDRGILIGSSLSANAASLSNAQGMLIGSGGNLTLNTGAAINNTGGIIASALDTNLTANTITGNGQVIAGRDASLSLQGNYTNVAGNVIKANRNLTFTTTGLFTNQTTIEALGNLTLNASNIDNQTPAIINSANTLLNSGAGNITNAGRIEGNSIATTSNAFSNTGAVIGDSITLRANSLSNLNAAAIIAATQSVNLIVQNTLVNQDGATIYSLGDINIGSNLNVDPVTGYLMGNAVSVTNSSATIEAVGNLRIGANTLTNQRSVVGVQWGPEALGAPVVGNPRYTPSYANEQFTANTTAAAQLLSGMHMQLGGGVVLNDYSTISAGQSLTSNAVVTNTGAAFLQRMTVTNGLQDNLIWVQTGWSLSLQCLGGYVPICWPVQNPTYGWVNSPIAYAPAPTYTTLAGSVNVTYAANTPITAPVPATPAKTTISSAAVPTASVGSTLTVPASGLYTIHSQPGQQYLVVTDPRFTSYQNFVSSDYMMSRMVLDPSVTQKRLGDGFYEQQLVADQLLNLTGRRNLANQGSTQASYQVLMDGALEAASELKLVPGIALDVKQVAALKHDIVWMVEEDVLLPDGSMTRALAPKVYLSQATQMNLAPSGALISANTIDFQSSGVFDNSGTVISDAGTSINVGDLINRGSIRSGSALDLHATNDILNISGLLAGHNVYLNAGRDIRNERTAQDISNNVTLVPAFKTGLFNLLGVTGGTSSTSLGLEANITASDGLSIAAGRDLSIVAATIKAGGNASIGAGNNLTIGTLATHENSSGAYDSYRNTVKNLGSQLDIGGNLTMQAGNDLQLTAAKVNVGKSMTFIAGGNIALNAAKDNRASGYNSGVGQEKYYDESVIGTSLNAGKDITLAAINGQSTRADGKGNVTLQSTSVSSQQGDLIVVGNSDVNVTTMDEKHESFRLTRMEKSGLLSSTTTTTVDVSKQIFAIGSTLDADNVLIQTGRDINITGSNLVASLDVALKAGNNITIAAAQNTSQASSYRDEKTSGMFSNGGISVTIGFKQQTDTQAAVSTTHTASTIGSIGGNISIDAGKGYIQSGSDLITPGNLSTGSGGTIDIAAQNVLINEVQNVGSTVTESKFKQSGITVAASNPVMNTVQTANQMKKAASQASSDRLKALAATSAALSAYNSYDLVSQGRALKDGNLADQVGGIKVSVGMGSSSSESSMTQTWSQSQGSNLAAGGNINIRAKADNTEEGKDTGGNITIQGSTVHAGNDAVLFADNTINLLAAQNASSQQSTNQSSNTSLGLSASLGTNGGGFNVDATASRGHGSADGSDLTWTNTQIGASGKLALRSGGDATIKGATASGKQIVADVGGNLNVASLQETSTYNSQQSNAGFNVSVPLAGSDASASLNIDKSHASSTYASVTQQSGLYAGDGGFQIGVEGNTNLNGAMIASTDKAIQDNVNSLVTATFTKSDIANRFDANVETSGINLSSDMFTQGKYGMGKAAIANSLKNDQVTASSAGVTRSAVSVGSITISDDGAQQTLTGRTVEQTIVSLNRDTANAHTAAQKQDVQALQQSVQNEQAIEQAVYTEAVKFTDESYRTMFLKQHPMYELLRDKDGKLQQRLLSDREKQNLVPGTDGKVHLATNGIFNDDAAAAKYATQHATGSGPQYVVLFPEASNALSELLIAGYQKYMENDFTGLTNSTMQVKETMNQYGQSGLHLDGHSRGSMTIGNAMESKSGNEDAKGSLSGTTINFFGPAYNAQDADFLLGRLQDRTSMPTDQQSKMILMYETHIADPVGRIIGGNDPTGGSIPSGSSVAWEAIRAGTGQESTSHNLYFVEVQNFQPKTSEKVRANLINQFWGNGLPQLIPANKQ